MQLIAELEALKSLIHAYGFVGLGKGRQAINERFGQGLEPIFSIFGPSGS